MTELRDARFKKALETAPDAAARPAAAVAQAIRAAAHQAVAPAAPERPQTGRSAPWWQRLWQATAQPQAPWNAAFATVLLAVLLTVLWVREPVPDARPLAPPAPAAPSPVTPAAPAPMPAAEPAQTAQDSARSSERATAKAASPSLTRPTPPAAVAPVSPVLAPPAESAAKSAVADTTEPAKDLAGPAADASNRAAPLQRDRAVVAQSLPVRPDTARAVAPMVAETAPVLAPAPASSRLSGLESWTALSVEMEGRAVTLDRARGQRLFADMRRLALRMKQASTPVAEQPVNAPALRLGLVARGQTLAVLELWQETALWRRPGQADVWASVAAAEVQALLQLAHQALAPAAPE